MTTPAERTRGGRTLDPSRDHAIRAAALEVLAEVGYEGLTMDLVAARARAGKGALYRRWPSKLALVVDAINCLRPLPPLPDRGSLRADLEALSRLAPTDHDDGPPVAVMIGLITAAQRDPELADAIRTQFIEPRKAPIRAALTRAQQRGEIGAHIDIELIADLVPALIMHRAILHGTPPDAAFIAHVVRSVVVPALFDPGDRGAPAG